MLDEAPQELPGGKPHLALLAATRIEQGWVCSDEFVQLVGHSEHHMEIANLQQLLLPRVEPTLAHLGLTLWTVPIAAGIIRDGFVSAARTHVDMTAQGGGAAAADGTQDFQLLVAEVLWRAIQQPLTLRMNDVGHLDGGPAHVGLCSLRDRSN